MESGLDVTENKMLNLVEKHFSCVDTVTVVCPPQRSRLGGPSKAPLPGKTIEVRKCRLAVVRCASVVAVGVFLLTVQASRPEVVYSVWFVSAHQSRPLMAM